MSGGPTPIGRGWTSTVLQFYCFESGVSADQKIQNRAPFQMCEKSVFSSDR
jgi:hypothetical protein